MIAFLQGILAGKTPTSMYVNVGGVGFEVGMSQRALAEMPALNETVTIYTYLQVREDELSLYGFCSLEEKSLFEKLISVSGVGPKVALAALSAYESDKLKELIASQDVSAVQKIPGIGKKTASRIILELKGSLDMDGDNLFQNTSQATRTVLAYAQEALLSMGFSSAEAEVALKGAPEDTSESALIQYALKRLGS